VTAESDDLAGIVEDLLVAARTDLEAVPMSAERVDLGSIAKSTIDRMSAVPLGDTLPINGQADVKADPGRVRQILRNLVSNALRHGGDLIHIEIAVEGGTTTLSVRDGGDEIPQSAQDRIFEAYGTADKEHRHAHSIGLGLPVSRRLAELMGGTLTYRHQNGESIFELSLPEWVDSASTTEHRVLDHDAAAA